MKDNQIEIFEVQYSTAWCDESYRWPRYPLNLLVFRGAIENNQITGTMYIQRNYERADKKLSQDLVPSDFYVWQSYSFRADVLLDGGGNSFTMSKAFSWGSGHTDNRSQKWERE